MKRTIKLKCIKDPHVVEFVDGGIDREGQATSQRQALARVLSKRVDVDGKPLPVFLVHDVGQWTLGPTERMPDGDEWQRFEEDVIRREHPEHLLKRWEDARAKFIGTSVERRRQAEAQLEQQTGAEVAKGIQNMVKALQQQSATTPTKGAQRV